jgi:hypothetical protein
MPGMGSEPVTWWSFRCFDLDREASVFGVDIKKKS